MIAAIAPALIGIVSGALWSVGIADLRSREYEQKAVPFGSPRTLEHFAKLFGANLARSQVWTAFSTMYLDVALPEGNERWMAETIAQSPFFLEELGHILFFEVNPICGPSLIEWPGGEAFCFSDDWLIKNCLAQPKRNPFRSNGRPNEIARFVHSVAMTSSNACCLLYRARNTRFGIWSDTG